MNTIEKGLKQLAKKGMIKRCPYCGGKIEFDFHQMGYQYYEFEISNVTPRCNKCGTHFPDIGLEQITSKIEFALLSEIKKVWEI